MRWYKSTTFIHFVDVQQMLELWLFYTWYVLCKHVCCRFLYFLNIFFIFQIFSLFSPVFFIGFVNQQAVCTFSGRLSVLSPSYFLVELQSLIISLYYYNITIVPTHSLLLTHTKVTVEQWVGTLHRSSFISWIPDRWLGLLKSNSVRLPRWKRHVTSQLFSNTSPSQLCEFEKLPYIKGVPCVSGAHPPHPLCRFNWRRVSAYGWRSITILAEQQQQHWWLNQAHLLAQEQRKKHWGNHEQLGNIRIAAVNVLHWRGERGNWRLT